MGDYNNYNNNQYKNKFVEHEFEEVEGGYYDNGFYYTPNGSKMNFQKSNIFLIFFLLLILSIF